MVLLGVHADDAEADADWLAAKVAALRIFSDSEGKMNLSVVDIQGGGLVVSQFTLTRSTKKAPAPASFMLPAQRPPSHCMNAS